MPHLLIWMRPCPVKVRPFLGITEQFVGSLQQVSFQDQDAAQRDGQSSGQACRKLSTLTSND